MKPARRFSGGPDVRNLLLIAAAWVGTILLVNPSGDFPLNDDWAYGWTVKTLVDTGRYQLSDWTATNLLSQSLWGAMFCLPFGFSFTMLRASTLLLGLVGILSTYGLLRQANARPALALVGALTIAFNPVYVALSNTFNSDVPSFAFLMVSLFFLVRGLRTRCTFAIVIGVGVAVIAMLNRQSSIAILLALAPAILMRYGVTVRTLLTAISPAIMGVLTQMIYSRWLEVHSATPALFGLQIEKLRETWSSGGWTLATTYVNNAFVMAAYVGLFVLPWLLAGGAAQVRRRSRRAKAAAAGLVVLMCVVAADYVLHGKRMPLATNVLEPFSVGPHTIDGYVDAYYANLGEETKSVIGVVWTLLTVTGFAAAGVLIVCLIFAAVDAFRTRHPTTPAWMLMLTLVSSVLYFTAIGGLDRHYWYDRYLIPLLPLVMVSLTASSSDETTRGRRIGLAAALLVLTLYGGFAAAATHDYLSWNRTRWRALNALAARGVPAERIFGGFEFNGWHFGHRLATCNAALERSGPIDYDAFDCLWGSDRGGFRYEYRTAFTRPPPGYGIAETYSFRRWLPWSIQPVYVLRRSQ